jgi:hypothetical protein
MAAALNTSSGPSTLPALPISCMAKQSPSQHARGIHLASELWFLLLLLPHIPSHPGSALDQMPPLLKGTA